MYLMHARFDCVPDRAGSWIVVLTRLCHLETNQAQHGKG